MAKPKTKGPNPIDVHVGSRMRMRRMMLGMSQEALAKAFGLSFQQVQKYEKGINRMGSSRLQQAAHVLEVDIPFSLKAGRAMNVLRHHCRRTSMNLFQVRTGLDSSEPSCASTAAQCAAPSSSLSRS
jgi:transcriptional regulator with XRE-family HTH domain